MPTKTCIYRPAPVAHRNYRICERHCPPAFAQRLRMVLAVEMTSADMAFLKSVGIAPPYDVEDENPTIEYTLTPEDADFLRVCGIASPLEVKKESCQ